VIRMCHLVGTTAAYAYGGVASIALVLDYKRVGKVRAPLARKGAAHDRVRGAQCTTLHF
jgi:hypothetical protein